MLPFHLAFTVHDLGKTRAFYHDLLGCPVGRTSDRWIDFDFFGHQITAHLQENEPRKPGMSLVDGDQVPARHFGAILNWQDWKKLSHKLKEQNAPFILEPKIRFKGMAGEQGTFFIGDPSGNALEFKTFRDMSRIFAKGPDFCKGAGF